jgi:hypothetical protein
MMLLSALGFRKSGPSRPRNRGFRSRCRCRPQSAGLKLSLERLEGRNLLSGGLNQSLVDLSGATPLPIPLPLSLAANPFGGMDIYQNFQGPADADPLVTPLLGSEPNQITNFNGFYGGVRVQGTGTAGDGLSRFWDADLRFMKGEYQALDSHLYRRTFVEI